MLSCQNAIDWLLLIFFISLLFIDLQESPCVQEWGYNLRFTAKEMYKSVCHHCNNETPDYSFTPLTNLPDWNRCYEQMVGGLRRFSAQSKLVVVFSNFPQKATKWAGISLTPRGLFPVHRQEVELIVHIVILLSQLSIVRVLRLALIFSPFFQGFLVLQDLKFLFDRKLIGYL